MVSGVDTDLDPLSLDIPIPVTTATPTATPAIPDWFLIGSESVIVWSSLLILLVITSLLISKFGMSLSIEAYNFSLPSTSDSSAFIWLIILFNLNRFALFLEAGFGSDFSSSSFSVAQDLV